MTRRGLLFLLNLGLLGEALAAEQRSAATATNSKQAYSWNKPTPRANLREMSTDRPDATESPFTVDAGRVQLELDFGSHARDEQEGVRTREWEAAAFNLRFGLTTQTEVGVFFTPYRRVTEKSGPAPGESHSGPGDVTLRGKWNLVGNDGGPMAWGLMADVKLPTASRTLGNRKWEGALTLPVAFELAAGWGGGAMTSVGLTYTGARRHEVVWINTVTFARELTERVGGFLEVTSSAGDGRHVATFNVGLTARLNPDTQLDAGVNFGISQSAADQLFFTGLSRRF